MDVIEIQTRGGGIVTFDGRVIEHFDDRTRVSSWRIHVGHMVDWVIEARKGTSQVKVMVAKREFQNFLVDDEHLPAFEQLRQAVDAARG